MNAAFISDEIAGIEYEKSRLALKTYGYGQFIFKKFF